MKTGVQVPRTSRILCALAALAWSFGAGATAWSAGGAGPDFVFGTPEAPLASGTIDVGDARSLTSLTVHAAAGATISVTNGSLAFADAAQVRISSGATLALDLPVSCAGALTVDSTTVATTETVEDLVPPCTAKTAATLDAWSVAGGRIGLPQATPVAATACNAERTDAGLDVQLQAVVDNRICCVKVRLAETDGDLALTQTYARSLPMNGEWGTVSVGVNFDAIPVADDDNGEAIAHTWGGAVSSLTFRSATKKARVVLAGTPQIAGNLTVAADAEAIVPQHAPYADAVFETGMTIDGSLGLGSGLTFSNTVSGATTSCIGFSCPAASPLQRELFDLAISRKQQGTIYDTVLTNCFVYQI